MRGLLTFSLIALIPGLPLFLFFGGDRGAQCWTSSVVPGAFDGLIDDVRVWDYALGADEVRAMSRE